jgi:hypothetical protein
MTNNLVLEIYPKNAEVACMVFKSSSDFLRENHLFNYKKLVDDLEMINAKLGNGLPFMECINLRDKRNNEFSMVCAFSHNEASLTILKKKNQRKKNLAFCWKGTVAAFVNAVNELLRKLGRLAK